jgi:hypothetical protein
MRHRHPSRFPSGRHLASFVGLTPREYSSGLRRRLGTISKRGDAYLRSLLIHGARSILAITSSPGHSSSRGVDETNAGFSLDETSPDPEYGRGAHDPALAHDEWADHDASTRLPPPLVSCIRLFGRSPRPYTRCAPSSLARSRSKVPNGR